MNSASNTNKNKDSTNNGIDIGARVNIYTNGNKKFRGRIGNFCADSVYLKEACLGDDNRVIFEIWILDKDINRIELEDYFQDDGVIRAAYTYQEEYGLDSVVDDKKDNLVAEVMVKESEVIEKIPQHQEIINEIVEVVEQIDFKKVNDIIVIDDSELTDLNSTSNEDIKKTDINIFYQIKKFIIDNVMVKTLKCFAYVCMTKYIRMMQRMYLYLVANENHSIDVKKMELPNKTNKKKDCKNLEKIKKRK